MSSASLGHRFKDITAIPNAKDLIDIVLSKTQRKTPTQVHPQFQISRIRSFYMRKVKYCQQTIHDRLSMILSQFPRLDEIHPFYSDLCNVLYDRDHYKLALGHISGSRNIVDSLAKDYVRLLKYADSPYKCKMLKRAALGRMCTCLKKLQAPLEYLEEVRQHIGRLPSINPTTRTIIVCGYPNVGKSSFVNCVSHANVEVEPYAFTTKSLYVGHFDYNYTRWQVIDTPGILDRPLDERNTIEMTAITALAHIHSCILYFIDISEECGYSIERQVQLYHSIKTLFRNKPVLIILNKTDSRSLDSLTEEEKRLIETIRPLIRVSNDGTNADNQIDVIDFMTMSTLKKIGVEEAKNRACDELLKRRIERKVQSRRIDTITQRLHIAETPISKDRPPFIPDSVIQEKMALSDSGKSKVSKSKSCALEIELEEEFGGAGVYQIDWNRKYILKDNSWKYDIVPEIIDGKNIMDFVDPDIEEKLKELEKEEEVLLMSDPSLEFDEKLWDETQTKLKNLHLKVNLKKRENMDEKARNAPTLPRGRARQASAGNIDKLATHLDNLGYQTDKVYQRGRSLARKEETKRGRSLTRIENSSGKRMRDDAMIIDDETLNTERKRARGHSTAPNRIEASLKPGKQREIAEKLRRKTQVSLNKQARKGEADRSIPTKMPKYLFSGKRGLGKTNKR
ncbi:nucleolar GTP-binding protein 1, putative [Cryptosporidium muris RN66]|uniref:Nucleolar GTP-binding protein 1 n=1 Tax=Cryptosporidium muris (strain RN66) TaxID=441375 RepID=B6AII4_CRYMR|nr:nucleolar GTP-binding protein 1, putative [Cryptosporidium muris RN66]EEA08025.1 nucleolar GTP-binding protein 1, putative [Cryptosporidium muris RN66]|eukprot:XP_002142374.1 nucleolar GTP-binding protein 1 [Cryptosporidium muris RN66]